MLKRISRILGIVTAVLLIGAATSIAHPLSARQRAEVRHAARVYARTVDPTHARLRCHQWHCTVHQPIDSGQWSQWTVVYRVDVWRDSHGRLNVSSPMFRGHVPVRR